MKQHKLLPLLKARSESVLVQMRRVWRNEYLWALLIYAVIMVILIAPSYRIYFWLGHEEYYPLQRVKLMSDLWRVQGPFHTPWFPDVCHGYGWPFFTFYAPLGYYLACAVQIPLHLSVAISTKISFDVALILSGLFVFGYTAVVGRREGWPRIPWWGMAAAVIFCLTPYHMTDMYSRSSLAECWGFATVPGMFCALEYSRGRRWLGAWVVAAAYALLMLSHNITALYCTVFIGLYTLLTTQKPDWPYYVAAGGTLGAGMSAYYWLPAMMLKKFVRASDPWAMNMLPEQITPHAIYWTQHLFDRWGKGLSLPGPQENLGITIGNVILVSLGLAVAALVRPGLSISQRIRIVVLLLLTGVCLFVASPQMNWTLAPITLRYIQLSWRLMLFTAFFGCAALVTASRVIDRWMNPIILAIFAAVLSIPYVLSNMMDPTPWGTAVLKSDEELQSDFDRSEKLRIFVGSVAQEYAPVWVNFNYLSPEFQAAHPVPLNRLSVIQGDPRIENYQHVGAAYEYQYTATSDSVVRIHVFDFPGWYVYLDGKRLRDANDRDSDGLVRIKLPGGEHRFKLVYRLSPIGILAEWITIASTMIWVGCGSAFLAIRIRERRARNSNAPAAERITRGKTLSPKETASVGTGVRDYSTETSNGDGAG